MYIIIDSEDHILFSTKDFQDLQFIVESYDYDSIYVYELDFINMTIKTNWDFIYYE